ncbi:hypothetical protein [Micromonospora sp. DT229]|uniref:hypothetical protein n=1 Tax=Micromonospora sp. DT229 TaxID=3393430 RepID=UPI003CECF307
MTRAPENLMAVRRLLLDHLDVDPGKVRDQDLEPNEVGIIGDAAHRGGYHCGSDRVVTNDYSVVESSRDRNGLTLDAAALDVGMFQVSVGGRNHNLATFSAWCVAQCQADAPDARDIREIIYSPDGKVVRRWDRLGRRNTGDRSHLWHTHFSFFRDSIKANRDQTPLFRRYLTTIGLIKGPTGITPKGDIMTPAQEKKLDQVLKMLEGMPKAVVGVDAVPAARPPWNNADFEANKEWRLGYALQTGVEGTRATLQAVEALRAEVARVTGQAPVDPQVIVQGVLAGLAPEVLAAHIVSVMPESLARQVVDELSRALQAAGKQS